MISSSSSPDNPRLFVDPLQTASSLSSLHPSLAASSTVSHAPSRKNSFLLANDPVGLSVDHTRHSESSDQPWDHVTLPKSEPTHVKARLVRLSVAPPQVTSALEKIWTRLHRVQVVLFCQRNFLLSLIHQVRIFFDHYHRRPPVIELLKLIVCTRPWPRIWPPRRPWSAPWRLTTGYISWIRGPSKNTSVEIRLPVCLFIVNWLSKVIKHKPKC